MGGADVDGGRGMCGAPGIMGAMPRGIGIIGGNGPEGGIGGMGPMPNGGGGTIPGIIIGGSKGGGIMCIIPTKETQID